MPSRTPILTHDLLYEHTHRHAFGGARRPGPDRVGLEVELVPFVAGGILDGCRRESVARVADTVAWLTALGERERWDCSHAALDAPRFVLPAGGVITLEPGGQVEYSSSACADADTALDEVDAVVALLEASGREAGIDLRTRAFNADCDVDEIGLQLRAPRYVAMDAYLAEIGPYGRAMMRATCALQINVDFGEGAVAAERWRLANMIAPAMNALFASSPHLHDGRYYRSFRGEIWRHVDPTRTGRLFDRPDLDPVADYLRFALDARVMLVIAPDGTCTRPPMPTTFREWMEGTAELGYPSMADWSLHLTTLFPDVRARGFVELRSIDALPADRRREAVHLVTTLMYDATIRREALRRLESRDRVRTPGEHEHDGHWGSDFDAGRELAGLAGFAKSKGRRQQ